MGVKFIQYWVEKIEDPLYKNSFFILITNAVSSGFGFFFWVLAAKLCIIEDVGISTALLSSIYLLNLFTRFGMDMSLLRFFPNGDKGKIFFSSLIITTISSIILGTIFLLRIDFWSPGLKIIQNFPIIFLLILGGDSIVSMSGISFVALRKSEYYFYQAIIMGSRVICLIPLASFGAIGIFSSVGISHFLTIIFSFLSLYRMKVNFSGIDRNYLIASFKFSAANYIANLFQNIPNLLFPIMIINVLGPNEAAHYYLTFAIASLLFLIPIAFGTSLLVEGSHGESIGNASFKSLTAIFALLIPLIIVIFIFGKMLLGLIGKDYTEGFELLKIFAISSFFMAITKIYLTIKNLQKDIKQIILICAIIFTLITSCSYFLLSKIGILGIGYAWIIGYGIGSLIIVISSLRDIKTFRNSTI